MAQLRGHVGGSAVDRRTPRRKHVPRTRIATPPAPLTTARRRFPATRIRAIVPVLLAPTTITLSAIAAAAAGLPGLGVLIVAVVVGLAGAVVAHRTVGNLVAGAILLLGRPFEPGDRLRIHVPELDRTAEVELVRIGLLTSTLCTDCGLLVLPNGRLLATPPAA